MLTRRKHRSRKSSSNKPLESTRRQLGLESLEDRRMLAVVFADSFESGEWDGKWVEDSQLDWSDSTQRATDGNYSAEVDGRATNATLTTDQPIDMMPYGSAELTFDWLIENNFDSGEYLALDFSHDGLNWNEINRLSGNVDQENTWHSETVVIDPAYLTGDFKLRFRALVSVSKEDANVDNVKIVGTPVGPPELSISDVSVTEGDTAFHFMSQFVTPSSGGLHRPREMAVGLDGDLYVTSDLSDQVLRYDGTTGVFIDEFVDAGSGGLERPFGIVFGPDDNLYVSSDATDEILRYDGATGDFIDVFASNVSGPDFQGIYGPGGLTFGADGNLYVTTQTEDTVVRFDGVTGAFIDVFVASGSGGLRAPKGLTFGPDDNLYVASFSTNSVLRYDGITGAFMDAFVLSGSGGLNQTEGLTFGPNGDLYVVGYGSDGVLRYNGMTGGFIAKVADGIDAPIGITFDEEGNFYVGSTNTNEIHQYGTNPEAVFTVSLSSASGTPVTVEFDTADALALASSDYSATSGTLTFAPGETEKTIVVPTIDDGLIEDDETFTVMLSNPVGATIPLGADIGTGTILDDDTPLPPSNDVFASSEQNVSGTVSGNLTALNTIDGTIETITEELYARNKRSRLEHIWTFNGVATGDNVDLIVDASHNSTTESFEWSYSIDGSSWTTLGTVEDGSSFALPSNLSNTFQIRVIDTNRSQNEKTLDTLTIDQMLIRTTTGSSMTTTFASEQQAEAEPLDRLTSSLAEARHRRGDRSATDAFFASL